MPFAGPSNVPAPADQLRIEVDGHSPGADIRDLAEWLTDVDELRGAVSRQSAEAVPGALGWSDIVVVALGSGVVASALVPALLSWLRNRTYDVHLTVRSGDGESVADLRVDRVRDPAYLREVTVALTEAMKAGSRQHNLQGPTAERALEVTSDRAETRTGE